MTATVVLDDLAGELDGSLERPGSPGYRRATTPRNTTATQHPAAVAVVAHAGDVATCVRVAAGHGLSVQVQATGHGAAGTTGPDVLLVDTSGLAQVDVDPDRAVARVGAGTPWAAVQAAAWPHGLLGPSGTAGDVGVAGYLFHGGVGWLTRPHGLASGGVRAVDHVDGRGRLRRAAPEAADPQDRDALWTFRGGGGVGIATAIEVDLHPARALWAGYLLWPVDQVAEVVGAWARALPDLHHELTTTISLLHAPAGPAVPEHLQGRPVVHLAAASVAGADGMRSLREALAGTPAPAVDTLGPAEPTRLVGIHLDPPAPVPALGDGRWLTTPTPEQALRVLTAAGTGADSPLGKVELRHLALPEGAPHPEGALTELPGPMLLHAVGAAPDPERAAVVDDALDAVRTAAGDLDTGRGAAAFRDGRTGVDDALDPAARRRVAETRRAVDPDGVITSARRLV